MGQPSWISKWPPIKYVFTRILEGVTLSFAFHVYTHIFSTSVNTTRSYYNIIDYFLISTNLLNLVTQSNIIPGFLSDHSVITLDINLSETVRGPGHFKINNSILLNEDYKANINSAIQEIVEINKDCNPNTLWELIKGSIRNESIRIF